MKATITKSVRDRFKRRARKSLHKEEFGILLGTLLPNGSVSIEDIYFPQDRLKTADEETVNVYMDWFHDAKEWAKTKSLLVLGDIHSHFYVDDGKSRLPRHEPSEEDWESARVIHDSAVDSYCLFGICRVILNRKTGKIRSSIKLWPLTQDVETIIVETKEEE